ncbi:MAG: response regulator [Candidatus Omnitrophica bacterium]|nr:response regulator [Candidatus Omnitrophota bacterium]
MSKKILIVDDDKSVGRSLAILLREDGYFVDTAMDSTEGALFIEKSKYDAYLFDYKMKGLNGGDLLKITRTKYPQCAVFIISGMMDADTFSVDGVTADVIHKPFDIDLLLQKIRIALKEDSAS